MGTELLKYKYLHSSRERVYIETGLYSTSKHLIVKPELTFQKCPLSIKMKIFQTQKLTYYYISIIWKCRSWLFQHLP